MARPKAKGPQFCITLPLDVHAFCMERSVDRGETLAVYVAHQIERLYEQSRQENSQEGLSPKFRERTEPLSEEDQEVVRELLDKKEVTAPGKVVMGCSHPRVGWAVLTTGLVRCECGAVRGLDKVWR